MKGTQGSLLLRLADNDLMPCGYLIPKGGVRMLKPGDVVQYANPSEDERGIRFVVLEAHYDVPIPRARVRMLNSGMQFEPEEILRVTEFVPISSK